MNWQRFTSRKFILAVVTGIIVIVNGILEAKGMTALDEKAIIGLITTVGAFIFGEAWTDAANKK